MGKPHSICYFELPTRDIPGSGAFYEKVFDWKLATMPGGDYAELRILGTEGEEAGKVLLSGGLDPSRKPAVEGRGVLLYVECEDIPALLARVDAAGGATVKPRTEIPGDHGFYAHLRDPSGNVIGLWSRT